jgi:TonB family protein
MLTTLILVVATNAAAYRGGLPPPVRVVGSLAPAEAGLKGRIEREPHRSSLYLDLAEIYESVGSEDEAERVLRQALAAAPGARDVYERLFAHFRRLKQYDRAVPIADEWRRSEPASADPHVALAWLYLYHPAATLEDRLAFVTRGLAAADAALAIQPSFSAAFEVKRQLLALKWIVSDGEARPAVEAEQRALDAVYTPPPSTGRPARGTLRSPRPQTPMRTASGRMPLRAGGGFGEPARTAFVQPRYPEEAIKARIQGQMYVEVLIDEDGAVSDARAEGLFPLLDTAALESVRQWRFEPTILYGKRVPVVLGIRVEFVLTLGRD